MNNKNNQNTTKKSKKDSQEMPVKKMQTSKKVDTSKLRKKEVNLGQQNTELKSNKNQKELNNIQNIFNQQNINKLEKKHTHKNSFNAQTILRMINPENKKDVNKKISKFKEDQNINNDNLEPNSKFSNKEIKTQIKDKESESHFFNDVDLISDDKNPPKMPKENLIQSYNMEIRMNFNTYDKKEEIQTSNKNNDKNIDISPSKNPKQKKKIINDNPKQNDKNNKSNLKQSKTEKAANKSDTNIDIIIVGNELEEESQINQITYLKHTKFPNLSMNPFIKNNKKKEIFINQEENKTISELKKNLKQNDPYNSNQTNDITEKIDLATKEKNLNSNIFIVKSPSNNQKYLNISGDVPSVNTASKKTLNSNANTEFSENPNLENLYRKLLILAKRGDKEKFLEIYGQILNLSKNSIDINYKDENGFTALHYACDEGNLKIVEIILKVNCDTNIRNIHKQTPLHLSAKRGYFDISKKLIEFGAELNVYDSEKNTPLHYVCINGPVELLKFFLTKSPLVNEENIYGKKPIDLTTIPEIKNILEEYISKNENILKKSKMISNNNGVDELHLKTKAVKREQKPKNDFTQRNRANTLNINQEERHSNIQLNNKGEFNKSKENTKQNLDKEHLNKNKSLYSSTNYKIELGNNNINNSLKILNNKNFIGQASSSKTNKNCILKKELKNKEGRNIINKEKTDSNIYFQNTNNINNNNININIYSIDPLKKTQTNAEYLSSHSLSKENYKNRGYISIDESQNNDSSNIINTSLNKTNASVTEKILKKLNTDKNIGNIQKTKNSKKSKFYKNKSNNIFESLESSDKNNFILNKTEENIIYHSQMSHQLKSGNNKNVFKNLNESVNFNYLRTKTAKNKKDSNNNNSKIIQSTEQLLSKAIQQPKKKQKKVRASKNIDDSQVFKTINNINLSKISTSKTNKLISDIELINKSNILPINPKKNLLDQTSSSIEHISPSNFICLAQLGKGSFGEVYLVKKEGSSEKYAMKVLRKERIMSQNLLKYAVAERNVLSSSNHPFIVKFHYAFQTSTKLFLILEYCPNGDLAKHLMFEKRFKEPRAKFYLCEILLAIENLHKRDVIFRDLKPDNVVLDKDGHCKLTDFGLSKEGVKENSFAQSFCGSIAYLAPEMLKKQGHGKAVDWYLLGVLFYEMLVGITPYFTTRKEDIFHNIEYGELKVPNFVSKEAEELLKRLLERNPNKRLGGGGRDAAEIKEHPYFKDVDWKKVYEKKIKPPNFVNYMDKSIKYYNRPRLFANDDFLDKTEEQYNQNILKGWSFVNNNDIP